MREKKEKDFFIKDLARYNVAERILFFANVILALIIIIFAQRLMQTQFGKAALTFGMVMLVIVIILRILKIWGPKD